jgi:hypothetical protein
MCCVMPPASPATTLAWRIASSSEVLPWSTWPITVTTGGRGASLPDVGSLGCAKNSCSLKPVSCTSKPNSAATFAAVATSIEVLIETIVPSAISLRWTSGAFEPSWRARSPTEICPSMRNTRRWSDADRAAAGRFSASRRLRRGEAAVRGSTVTWRRTGARPTAWRASVSCSRRLTTSRTSLRWRPERSGPGARSGASGARRSPPLGRALSRSSACAAIGRRAGSGSGTTIAGSSGWGSGSSEMGSGSGSTAIGSRSDAAATSSTIGSGAGSGAAFLRRRITAPPAPDCTRRSVTTEVGSAVLPSFSRNSAAVSSSTAAIGLFSSIPTSAARSTIAARSMPSSSASLYALMFAT